MTPLLLFLLACASAYLGTVTAAFNALMRLSLRIRAESAERDTPLGRYLDDPRHLYIPARILITSILMVATALLARVTGVERAGFPALVLIVIALSLVCEHVVPLLIVRKDPERVLAVLLPSFDVVASVLRPLTGALLSLGRGERVERSPDEATDAAHAEPPPSSSEGEAGQEGQARELLRSLVEFRETMVREVMTPRPDIIAIEAGSTLAELVTLFRDQQYSRIPVFKETLDNVVGIAFVKDVIQLKDPASAQGPVTSVMRPAYFVPETKRVPELLKEFQRKRVQSAIVVDEYGGTAGLVTIEDLLEEIVGEIRDEYDVETEAIVDEGHGRFVFSGAAHVEDMAERLRIEVEGDGFETVGGFLLSRLGRVPTTGEHFELEGLQVEVLESERRRIRRVRMTRVEPPAGDAGAAA